MFPNSDYRWEVGDSKLVTVYQNTRHLIHEEPTLDIYIYIYVCVCVCVCVCTRSTAVVELDLLQSALVVEFQLINESGW